MVGPPGSSREQQQEEGGAAGERGPLSRRKPGWLSEGRVLTEGVADAALVGRSQGAGQSTPPHPPGIRQERLSQELLQASPVRMASTERELNEALTLMNVLYPLLPYGVPVC